MRVPDSYGWSRDGSAHFPFLRGFIPSKRTNFLVTEVVRQRLDLDPCRMSDFEAIAKAK